MYLLLFIFYFYFFSIATESYVKCDSTYYYGKEYAIDDNNVMIYRNTETPFFNTKYLNGTIYAKTSIYI